MRNSGVIWGGLLILLGVLFLLNTLGILPAIPWRVLWPAALILLGIVVLLNAFGRRAETAVEALALQLKGFEAAEVEFHYGAGQLRIDSGAAPDELLAGSFGGGVSHQLGEKDSVAHVALSARPAGFWDWGAWRDRVWDVRLNGDIPLKLTIDSGAAEVRADLSATQTRRLAIHTGASSNEITLPAAAGLTEVSVEGGAGSVALTVPEGVAARIEGGVGAGSLNVDTGRFPRAGSAYQSADYDKAANRAVIRVTFGAGEVRVR